MTITERIVAAIEEQAERFDGMRYGRVMVEVQDGNPVQVAMTEKFKPTPEHKYSYNERLGENLHKVVCRCGEEFVGQTYLHVDTQLKIHIHKSK